MAERHTGSCSCGAVRFTISAPLRGVIYCHCLQCRKQTGHFLAATSAPEASLAIEGAEAITWYRASDAARRGFCRICGSGLFWRPEEGGQISILAGAFDTPTGLVAAEHIFVEEKSDYYAIDDGLPQRPKWDD
ncbi:MAG: GFA family protein [Rhizobiaceae bacterium]|nr:GFA family protein [Rhizobiaceae bacterium]